MEKGQPWTIPGNQYRKHSIAPTPQLESIQMLMQSTEKPNMLPLSPESTLDGSHSATPLLQCSKSMYVAKQSASSSDFCTREDLLSALPIPEEAQKINGGCFDAGNWVFSIVWNHVWKLNLSELLTAYYYREDRGKYGEHHTSTRGVVSFNDGSEDMKQKSKGSENHRHQERGRRIRHRYLQGEFDEHTSTFILNIAQKELPRIKATIKRMAESDKTSGLRGLDADDCEQGDNFRVANAAGKKLGKDDQLTAALISQHMASILIFRMHKEMVTAHEAVKTLESKLAANQGPDAGSDTFVFTRCADEIRYLQQRCETSEAERRSLEDEIKQLQKQLHEENHRNMSVAPPLLPLPVANLPARRSYDMVEDKLPFNFPSHEISFTRQVKRCRLDLTLPPITLQVNGRPRALPSPTPSHEGSPFPYAAIG